MKKTLIFVTALLSISTPALAHNVQIEINNVKSDQGMILAQIFKGVDGYNKNKPLMAQQISANEGSVVLTFSNLEDGEYAIRYFHDENNDGKLATNMFGMPTEGYGFSNNAKANFGPADYQDMKFVVQGSDVITSSTVTY